MNDKQSIVWNVPNTISLARLVLAIIVFALISLQWYWLALLLFVLAASTDWVDGWWARKFDQVTKLGRMLDPFCDKILICGVFILAAEAMNGSTWPWYARIAGWMAVVVVGREILVTQLRGFVELGGGDFSAKMHGKIKMWLQCIAAGSALAALASARHAADKYVPLPLLLVVALFAWLSVASTVYSGLIYVRSALKMITTNPMAAGN